MEHPPNDVAVAVPVVQHLAAQVRQAEATAEQVIKPVPLLQLILEVVAVEVLTKTAWDTTVGMARQEL
jgi:hypothetical protein